MFIKHSTHNPIIPKKISIIFSSCEGFLPLIVILSHYWNIYNKDSKGCYLYRYVEVIFHTCSVSYFYANYFFSSFPTFSQWNKKCFTRLIGLCNLWPTISHSHLDQYINLQFVILTSQLKLNTTSICRWSPPLLTYC